MPDAGPDFPGGMSYGFHPVVNSAATDAQKAAAWNLLNFIYNDPELWFERTGLLQPRTEWWQDPATQEKFEGLDVYMGDLIASKPLPRTPHWSSLQAALRGAIERVAFEDADPKASLDQAAAEYLEAIGQ
jgi:ABC-type glycerol-3-phosphate transport system substrate-binding protein